MSSYLDRKRGTAWRHTQISLYNDQHTHLSAQAAQQGISVAQLIRNLIDADMRRVTRKEKRAAAHPST